jgi:hypothetical protein
MAFDRTLDMILDGAEGEDRALAADLAGSALSEGQKDALRIVGLRHGRPKTMHFTGTYNGNAVDLTIECTY